MATLDRQLPSLDTFLCKPWSAFTDAAQLHYIDNFVHENHGKQLLNSRQAMKLNKEDMHLYGQVPIHEEFSLVVCNMCQQVVKPQGLLSHYERRHGSPSTSRTPLIPMKPKMALGGGSEVDALPFRVPRDYPHARFNKAPLAVYPPKGARAKPCVSLPVVTLEKMSCFGRTEGAHVKISSASSTHGSSFSSSSSSSSSSASSSPSSAASLKSSLTAQTSLKSQQKFLNGRGPITPPTSIDRRPSPSRSPLDKRPSPSPSSLDRRPVIPPSSPTDRTAAVVGKGSKHKRVSGRVFDPNKHCGVVDPETKRSCTRSLTCKTHSLTHRRAVPGRRKDFDVLLAEHKGRGKEKEGAHKREAPSSSQSVQSVQSHDPTHSAPAGYPNGKATPTLKLRLANPHIHRAAGGGGAVVLSSVAVAAPEPADGGQRPAVEARVSSDEGEVEGAEEAEKIPCHYSAHHPQPLSCCAFSSRLMGRGHYVFDRRWDRMRLALHRMVEKHVNSQMWRKVPLAVSGASPLGSPPPSSDGVSAVSYSAAVPHNGSGAFCIRDPDPGPKTPQRSKPVKPSRVAEGNGAPAAAAVGAKKRRHGPAPDGSGPGGRKLGNSYRPPSPLSNGTAALSSKARPTGRMGQGTRAPERCGTAEAGLPQALTGEYGLSLSHAGLSGPLAERRKRKSTGCADRTNKASRTSVLDGIFRKSSASLLSSASETAHGSLPRQPKVHH